MRFMKKSVILLLVIALVLSFALMPDVAEAQFKEHECKGKSCDTWKPPKCSGPSRRTNPHCR
jgi:hypothetical protein